MALENKFTLLGHALHLTQLQMAEMQSPAVAEDDTFTSQAEQGLINFTVDLLKVNYYALVAAMAAWPEPTEPKPTQPTHPGKPAPGNPAPAPGNPAPVTPAPAPAPAPAPVVPVVGSGVANLAAELISNIVK